MLRVQAAWVVLAVLTPEQMSHIAHSPGSNKEGKGPAPSLCLMAMPFRCMQEALKSGEESLQWPEWEPHVLLQECPVRAYVL